MSRRPLALAPNALAVAAGLILLLTVGTALAQTPFAVRNLGQRLVEGDARMIGRGGWGMTVIDSLHPGFKNPASLATVRHMVFSVSGYGEKADSESPGAARTTHRVYTPDIRVAVPVSKSRLALTAGFKLERASQWRSLIDSTWNAWSDTLSGTVQFEREGTTFKVPLGAAWQAQSWLALAAAVNLQSGSLRETLANYFTTPTSGFSQSAYSTNLRIDEDRYSGTSYTLGTLLTPTPRLRLGASWTSGYDLDVERKVEQGGVTQRQLSSFTLSLPAELNVGLSARLDKRWSVGGDWQMADYGDFAGRDDWALEMENAVAFGFGIERARATLRRGGWSNLPLRVGAGWRRWAYRVGDEPVEEKTVSVGTGFPFRRGLGQLDVAVTYALIGDGNSNGMESRVWRVAVSVTGLEAWW